jgi:ankyrin repeat protein
MLMGGYRAKELFPFWKWFNFSGLYLMISMKKIIATSLVMFLAYCANAQSVNDQLLKAVKIKNAGMVEQFLKAGADVNYVQNTNSFKVNLLILAVINDDIPTIRLLIEHKVNINWKDGFGDTALMYAAQTGNTLVINYLLDNGADIHAKDDKGNTVLSAAKEGKHEDAIKLIESKLK